ncbi:EAL domain-containing protein [Noviherbaspirillum sp. Root189]|uniref:EAL domain-containing protein n=1 Tax=Noviherbaspirillum sp. Root189 TaxID=1736487 RepID=UPI0007098EFF|nr:EAL domain-containing protein [Noviherbaspirillum sp. Root189]KRB84934.1 diguanylate phosphodiesterase [Noviherbaspirillum sp. Root189]
MNSTTFVPLGCRECREGAGLEFDFTMAFQPIVHIKRRTVYGYEALVRGVDQQSAGWVLEQVNESNRYRFDQACRVKAIELAARLGLADKPDCLLHINFLPNAVYRPETCIRATLQAAQEFNIPTSRLVFEVTEGEQVRDEAHLHGIFTEYRKQGFSTAIDDFGAGYSGLNLLANFQPDTIKLDMALTRNIDKDRVRRSIVSGVMLVCQDLGIRVIAEGVETEEELYTLEDMGIELFQGYLLGRPAFEELREPTWPA